MGANFGKQSDGLRRTADKKAPFVAFNQRQKPALAERKRLDQPKLSIPRACRTKQSSHNASEPSMRRQLRFSQV